MMLCPMLDRYQNLETKLMMLQPPTLKINFLITVHISKAKAELKKLHQKSMTLAKL